MPGPTNDINTHHHLPQFYLEGFRFFEGQLAKSKPRHVWVYERGRGYNEFKQGVRPEFVNPRLHSIKEAGSIYRLYSYTNRDGIIDIDSYEKALARRDEEDASLLRRIITDNGLGNTTFTEQEKLQFARFILLMHRRSPSHQKWIEQRRRKWIEKEQQESKHLDVLDTWMDATHLRLFERQYQLWERYLGVHYALFSISLEDHRAVGFDIMLRDLEKATPYLAQMHWHIFTAPEGMGFFTSDFPVYLTAGLKNELGFPINHRMALVALHEGRQSIEYHGPMHPEYVERFNKALAAQQPDKVYYHRNEKWVCDIVNESANRTSIELNESPP